MLSFKSPINMGKHSDEYYYKAKEKDNSSRKKKRRERSYDKSEREKEIDDEDMRKYKNYQEEKSYRKRDSEYYKEKIIKERKNSLKENHKKMKVKEYNHCSDEEYKNVYANDNKHNKSYDLSSISSKHVESPTKKKFQGDKYEYQKNERGKRRNMEEMDEKRYAHKCEGKEKEEVEEEEKNNNKVKHNKKGAHCSDNYSSGSSSAEREKYYKRGKIGKGVREEEEEEEERGTERGEEERAEKDLDKEGKKKKKHHYSYARSDSHSTVRGKHDGKREYEKKRKKKKRDSYDGVSSKNDEEEEEQEEQDYQKEKKKKEGKERSREQMSGGKNRVKEHAKGEEENAEEDEEKKEDPNKLSRLERLKLFAEKIKKSGNEKTGKGTKFSLTTTSSSAHKKVHLEVFMLNRKEEDGTNINRNISLDETILNDENRYRGGEEDGGLIMGIKKNGEKGLGEKDEEEVEQGEDPLELFMKNLEIENMEEGDDKEEDGKIRANQCITLDEIYSYHMNRHKFEKVQSEGEDDNANNSNEADRTEEKEICDKEMNKSRIQMNNASSEENQMKNASDEEDEKFHKLFIEALKKKAEDDVKKENEKEVKVTAENGVAGKEDDKRSAKKKQELEIGVISDTEENSNEDLSDDSEFNCETNSLKKVNKKVLQVNHDEIEYLPIKKNIYVQVSEITNMKENDVDMFRKNNGNIIVRGKNCPRPVQYFYQCGLPSKILPILEKKNFKKMFNIQMQTIPALMCGRDVIAIAETGSGKTLSYLFPLIRHVLHQPPLRKNDGPIGIILTPTRELSIQVKNEAKVYCDSVSLKILAVYGGSNIGKQLNTLKRGVEILVGTPGRIIDILTISNCKVTNLNRVSFVVLDEADRLLDLGFESQIHSILNNCRKDKQTAMISATFPNYIQTLAKKLLYKPIEIIVGEKGKTNNNIYQFVEVLDESKKIFRLLKLLGEWVKYGLILIFVNKQLEADVLYLELFKYDYKTLVLHGGQDQADRQCTLQNFKNEQNKILIATSVMARGIDIKNIILVINYECPDHIEDYIHRIGRTGRSNNIGYAYTFITPNEHSKAYDIYNLIKNNIYYLNKTIDIPPELETMVQQYANNKALAKKELGLVVEENADNVDVYTSDGDVENTSSRENVNMPSNAVVPPSPNTPLSRSIPINNNTHPNHNTQSNHNAPLNADPNEMKKIELEIQRIKMNDTMNLSLKAKKINELMKTYNFIAHHQNNYRSVNISQENDIDKAAEQEALKATEHIKDEKERQATFNKTKEDIKKKLINNKMQMESRNESIQRNMLLNVIRTKNMKKYSPYLPHTYITEDNTILEEFYINDYPQHVRLKISHRDVLARIADMSGASCQIKGQYANPSKPNKTNFLLDTKPLHIEITASTYNQVQIARNELTSLLNDFMQKCNIKNQKTSAVYSAFR
ncbi:pre-mRNA-processing ATP-dependent RNA helicase PRP5 [Plasmodium brasilianum]|uniref:Pre-mRNA-processing ATP-dependent RNA helicase PRP5 n=1 Tax=Plasmodium brasilianum TaxID=5824 RepID=A0ACB9YDB3_PLABR|nr:pre-mRNA-processing ATP-dependent RNA helicase PRP5 [Plasmodium brasilianum]